MRCKFLDNHLCVNPAGEFRLCCISTEPKNPFSITTHTVREWRESSVVKSAQQQLEQGVWPDSCRVCEAREAQGMQSQRSRPRRYGPGISNVDIRFGNSCNLSCVSCHSGSSSSIAQEAWDMQAQGLIPLHDLLDQPNHNWASPDTVNKLTELPIQEVYLTGGEPMMVKQVPQFLRGLDRDCHLRFNTNATVWNPQVAELLPEFSRVNMSLSIDAFGTKNDYIRYGSKWETVAANTERYQEICTVTLTVTVSTLNILYLDELYEWADQKQIEVYENPVSEPEWLHCKNSPDSMKTQFSRLQSWSAEPADPEQIDQFRRKILGLDAHRNIRIQDYLPEVAAAYAID